MHWTEMAPRKFSDEILLDRIRDDDEAALRELVLRYYARLGEFSFSIVKRRDVADEAVMNVFHNLWRRRGKLSVNGSLKSYLFSAVNNQAMTLRKQQKRLSTVHLDDVPQSQLIDGNRSDSDLLYRELRAAVEVLILNLPERRQAIFRMNRFEGLSYSEIAKEIGVTERTVQNHMISAFRQLAGRLPEIRRGMHR
jgi:RNA polymerase sigma-70 factor (ECF subfamily)